MNALRQRKVTSWGNPAPVKMVAPVPPPRGRFGQVWLSGEFIVFCQRHGLNPEVLAECAAHSLPKTSPDGVVIVSTNPSDARQSDEPFSTDLEG